MFTINKVVFHTVSSEGRITSCGGFLHGLPVSANPTHHELTRASGPVPIMVVNANYRDEKLSSFVAAPVDEAYTPVWFAGFRGPELYSAKSKALNLKTNEDFVLDHTDVAVRATQPGFGWAVHSKTTGKWSLVGVSPSSLKEAEALFFDRRSASTNRTQPGVHHGKRRQSK